MAMAFLEEPGHRDDAAAKLDPIPSVHCAVCETSSVVCGCVCVCLGRIGQYEIHVVAHSPAHRHVLHLRLGNISKAIPATHLQDTHEKATQALLVTCTSISRTPTTSPPPNSGKHCIVAPALSTPPQEHFVSRCFQQVSRADQTFKIPHGDRMFDALNWIEIRSIGISELKNRLLPGPMRDGPLHPAVLLITPPWPCWSEASQPSEHLGGQSSRRQSAAPGVWSAMWWLTQPRSGDLRPLAWQGLWWKMSVATPPQRSDLSLACAWVAMGCRRNFSREDQEVSGLGTLVAWAD